MLRPYSGPEDLQGMIDLLRARPPDRLDEYPGPVDLRELMEIEEFRAHTCLWAEAGGPVQAFAVLARYDDFASLVVETGSQEGEDLQARLIDWGLERAGQGEGLQEMPLAVDCRADNPGRMALLERLGFTRQEWELLHMSRSLQDPVPEPRLPEGFALRLLGGETEVEALVELHRAAWGTQNMTLEYRLAIMCTPSYDPAMDLVVTAPGGTLAGYCTCFVDSEANAQIGRLDGYTDPVAVRPAFQRKGLAKALLLEGMRCLQRRGIHTARLSTNSDNLAMQRAACAVGFEVGSRMLKYEKTV